MIIRSRVYGLLFLHLIIATYARIKPANAQINEWSVCTSKYTILGFTCVKLNFANLRGLWIPYCTCHLSIFIKRRKFLPTDRRKSSRSQQKSSKFRKLNDSDRIYLIIMKESLINENVHLKLFFFLIWIMVDIVEYNCTF